MAPHPSGLFLRTNSPER